MSAALPIRGDLPAEALRRHARHEANRRAALRMLAIANSLPSGLTGGRWKG